MPAYSVAERCEFRTGDTLDGKYRIERPLGEGSFGAVYKVSDAAGGPFAVKLLKLWTVTPDVCKNLRDRFVMEFETGRIKSDHLAHSYAYGEVKGNPYMLMEFCPNGDLKRYAATHAVDYVRTARQVLCGLRDLHACGKVHRDLKPENVLLRADETAVLTDFGIAGDQNKRMTERGWRGKPSQVFGTWPYMPPEQVNPPRGGQATVLPTTDIFSFGVMMYELLVGELPFGELSEGTLHTYLMNGKEGRWNRDVLKRIDKRGVWLPVIEGCLVPDFKERIQTAAQVLQMLPAETGGQAQAQAEASPNRSFMEIRHGLLLRVMQGEEYGKVYRLDELAADRHILTMGRDDGVITNAIAIREENSAYVSRRHCTLERDCGSGRWFVRDGQWVPGAGRSGWHDSMNGTYVNSTEVDAYGMPIRPGDILSLGDVKLRVEGY